MNVQSFMLAEDRERKVEELQVVCTSSGMISEESSARIAGIHNNLSEKFQTLSTKLLVEVSTVDDVSQVHDTLSFNRPKEVLKDVSILAGRKYVYQSYIENTYDGLRTVFRKCLSLIPEVDFLQRDHFKLKLESILQTYPDALERSLRLEMQAKWDEMSHLEGDTAQRFANYIKADQFGTLAESLNRLSPSQRQACVKRVKGEVTARGEILEANLSKSFSAFTFSKTCREHLIVLAELHQLSTLIPDVHTVYSRVSSAMKSVTSDSADSICQMSFMGDSSQFERRLTFLIQAADFYCEESKELAQLKEDLFPKEFIVMFKRSIQQIERGITENINIFQSAYSTKMVDEREVLNCLNVSKLWSNFFSIVSKVSSSVCKKLLDSTPAVEQVLYQGRCDLVSKLFQTHTTEALAEFDQIWASQKSEKELSIAFEDLDRRSANLQDLCKSLKDHPLGIDAEMGSFLSKIRTNLSKKDKQISELLSSGAPLKEEDSKFINLSLKRFKVLCELDGSALNSQELSSSLEANLKLIQSRTSKFIKIAEDDLKNPEHFSRALVDLKWHGMCFEVALEHVDTAIETLLKRFSDVMGRDQVTQLGVMLDVEDSGVGRNVIDESSILAPYRYNVFLTTTLPWDDVKGRLRCNPHEQIDVLEMEDYYRRYNEGFEKFVFSHMGRNLHDFELASRSAADKCRGKFQSLMDEQRMKYKSKPKGVGLWSYLPFGGGDDEKKVAGDPSKRMKIPWDQGMKEDVLTLCTRVFSLWSLYSTEAVFGKDKGNVGVEELSHARRPHPAQVAAVFRMLGIGYQSFSGDLMSSMHEVKTGEGKSLILGVTSAVLALLGFEVCVACYSKFLSERDYSDFKRVFEAVGVSHLIFYGTFQEVCERILNENVHVRDTTLQFLKRGKVPKPRESTSFEKILLIDEVDVFFDESFYGNLYLPVASLSSEKIFRLARQVWTNRNAIRSSSAVTSLAEYKEVVAEFPGQEKLINECIRSMLEDLKHFKPADGYIVKDDLIGYKEQDGVSFTIVYGYKTMFAYFFEMEAGQISEASCKAHTNLIVSCGEFSYVEIVHAFHRIIGVTGTLEKLSPVRSQAIEQEFHITKRTYIPSVYGESRRRFTDVDTMVVPENEFFLTISDQITKRRDVGTHKRPILVFFESKELLQKFCDNQVFDALRGETDILNEQHNSQERRAIVKKATMVGRITLCTRDYGRGVDFACRDKRVTSNGGVHVIQTFLSEDLAEEAQIQGRCARQGADGSYSMVLCLPSLERFFLSSTDFQNYVGVYAAESNKYTRLNELRNDFFQRQYANNNTAVVDARKAHQKGLKFLQYLSEGNVKEIQSFLTSENKGPAEAVNAKTLCLFDATGSMSSLLTNTKNTICKVFQDASEVFKQHGMDPNGFAVQIAVYRNYNVGDDLLLQTSGWEVRPENLRAFMNTIGPAGGMGNEAIEIGLAHANTLLAGGLTQVILIGDVPPNTRAEVQSRFNTVRRTKFTTQTYWEDELAKLKIGGVAVPVYAFYVHQCAANAFADIARRTGGTSSALDVNSDRGAELLKQCVTERILIASAGGNAQLAQDLVKTYRARHT
eukprot:TRINITY_DN4682_c0_g1_i4.p1 TRINITY_DN4682_c0_g1~~TRINITY_DN4682_c0_g1_i4.p1  ORF type:complete len:1758 (-),score=418.12 TRINITY_DN4682_c0_g1_i4:53-4783(-)